MSDLRPSLSVGEEQFWQHCMIYHLVPVRELVFAPPRKWRFDFAFPEQKLAVEIEGGTWSHGRHSRGRGFEADCVKYNMAAMLGWRILRFTSGQVLRGEAIDTVRAALKEKEIVFYTTNSTRMRMVSKIRKSASSSWGGGI